MIIVTGLLAGFTLFAVLMTVNDIVHSKKGDDGSGSVVCGIALCLTIIAALNI